MEVFKNRDKVAIVASGGGLGCSYSTGALKGLIKKYKLTEPDIVIAGSGSVGLLGYYLAKQYEYMERPWYHLLKDKKFINPARFWKIMDIDYLVNEIIKIKYPINFNAIKNSSTKFIISATDCSSGKVKHFDNFDKYDFFDIMRASKAIPIAYNRKVRINNKYYCDSSISSSVKEKVQKAVELGANIIIVLENGGVSPFVRVSYKTWLRFQSKTFRQNHPKYPIKIGKIDIILPKQVKLVNFYPKKEILLNPVRATKEKIRQNVIMGYRDVIKNKKLEKLLLT